MTNDTCLPAGRKFKFAIIYLLMFCAGAYGAGTQAGTSIAVTRAELYHDNQVEYSNELSVVVSQYYGLNLASTEVDNSIAPGDSCFFPHTLTNIGNGSDTFHFELSGTTDKWASTLVRDDNLNGLHEANETTPVEADLSLAEDASYAFFVVLTAPGTALSGEVGNTALAISGNFSDGDAYIGANGLSYGGPDHADSSASAKVAVSHDLTPPSITNIKLDGWRRFPEDIISKSPKLTATVLDDLPKNIKRIDIELINPLKDNPVFYHWRRNYDESTGSLEAQLEPALPVGTYSIKITAYDKSNNKSEELLGPFYVREDTRIIGKPLNYPNPFRPLKGDVTKIAYFLSKDMEITLYIYNIRGSAVWKRTYKPFEEGGKAGYNEVEWNGKSDFRQVLGNGIYIFKIVNENKVIGSGKITILDTR